MPPHPVLSISFGLVVSSLALGCPAAPEDELAASTDDLLTSAHEDWDVQAQGCLAFVNCQNFGSCFAAIDVCIADVEIELDVDVEETGDAPPPPPPSDDDGGDPSCTI